MTTYRLHALALAFALLSASTALSDDTSLQLGLQALKSGHAGQAIKHFSAELSAPDRTPEQRAKAFYLRAKAHYAAKQPALAMNDAASALWFNKLSAADAADAATIRGQALAEAMTSAAHMPAQPPAMPALEKAPPRSVTPASPPSAPAKPATASVEPARPVPLPSTPARQEPTIAKAAAPQPFTTTTAQNPEASIVTTVRPSSAAPSQPQPGPSAPEWAQAKVKREQLATVTVPPEELPARAKPSPQLLPPPQPIVTGSIEKAAPRPPEHQEAETAPIEALPWQAQPVRAANIAHARTEPEPAAAQAPQPFQTQRTSDIVTGSIGRREPAPSTSPAPQPIEAQPAPQTATPMATVAEAKAPEPQTTRETSTPSASFSAQGFAAMFASDNPMAADVARADELQRARYERIRQLNAARTTASQ